MGDMEGLDGGGAQGTHLPLSAFGSSLARVSRETRGTRDERNVPQSSLTSPVPS